MNLKELNERKVEIINEMENMCSDINLFNSAKFDEMKNELEDVENKISNFNNSTKIEKIKRKECNNNKMKLKDLLLQNKTIRLDKISNEGEMIVPDHGDIIVPTFEKTIEEKVGEEHLLFGMARKMMTHSPHNIPVQVDKLDEFLPVAELGEYQRKQVSHKTVQLGAEKFGLMVVLSEELLEDQDYNLEADIQQQIVEAFGQTMEKLIVKGQADLGIEGLLDAKVEEGAVEVKAEAIDYQTLVEMIFAMPKKLRKDGVFLVHERIVKEIMQLVDENKRPILDMNMGQLNAKFDGQILGYPVVITPELDGDVPAMFVNLHKALVVGVRRGMEIKRSDQAMFMNDAIVIKANCRVDAKLLDHRAVVKFVEGEVAGE